MKNQGWNQMYPFINGDSAVAFARSLLYSGDCSRPLRMLDLRWGGLHNRKGNFKEEAYQAIRKLMEMRNYGSVATAGI